MSRFSDENSLIELGAVGAPFGVRGWVKLRSFTDPPERLFQHSRWRVGKDGVGEMYRVESHGRSGGQLTAKFSGVDDRDVAASLRGARILIRRAELPARAEKDFYRADLIGCEVTNLGGVRLGCLDRFVETKNSVLMVVSGGRELWIPAQAPHLRRVDLAARKVVVDWEEAQE